LPQDEVHEVAVAAAIVRQRLLKKHLDAADIRSALRRCASEAAIRAAEIEIAAAAVSMMAADRGSKVLDDLRAYWAREREPEVKLALAEIIVRGTSEASTGARTVNLQGLD